MGAILVLSLLLPQSYIAAIGASAAKADYAEGTSPVSSDADPIVNISAASKVPGSALDSADLNESPRLESGESPRLSPPLQSGDKSGDGAKLLQFTSGNHVLGFNRDGVII